MVQGNEWEEVGFGLWALLSYLEQSLVGPCVASCGSQARRTSLTRPSGSVGHTPS